MGDSSADILKSGKRREPWRVAGLEFRIAPRSRVYPRNVLLTRERTRRGWLSGQHGRPVGAS